MTAFLLQPLLSLGWDGNNILGLELWFYHLLNGIALLNEILCGCMAFSFGIKLEDNEMTISKA